MLDPRAEPMNPGASTGSTPSECNPEQDEETITKTSTAASRKRKRDRDSAQVCQEKAKEARKPPVNTVNKLVQTAKATLTAHKRLVRKLTSKLSELVRQFRHAPSQCNRRHNTTATSTQSPGQHDPHRLHMKFGGLRHARRPHF